MNAGRVLHPRDPILHLQLATLQLGDLGIVARPMRERISDLLLKGPMLGLEFDKVLLRGHEVMVSFIQLEPTPKSDTRIVASRQHDILRRGKSPFFVLFRCLA